MFREMRRKKQSLSGEKISEILNNGTSGVLALSGDNDYPYAVPLSYVYDGSSIYFHAAKTGHKIDAVKRNNKASFCIIGQDDVVPEKYTTNYKSIIAFGKIRILDDEGEKRSAIEKLAVKYSPGDKTDREAEIKKECDNLCMLELQIDYITGKESIELTKIK